MTSPSTSTSAPGTAPVCTALALALALAAGLAPETAATQEARPGRTEAELRTLLDGTWYLTVPDSVGQAAIERAIERAVSEMNYLLQGLTRSQLREKTPLNRRIDLDFHDDGRITCVFDQRYTYTTRPGIAQDFDLPDGSTVNVNQFFRSGHFEQVFTATLGRRWNTYEISADGQTMTVTATTQGPMMPVPVVFALDYRQHR